VAKLQNPPQNLKSENLTAWNTSPQVWKGKKTPPTTDPRQQNLKYISPGIHNKDSFDLFSVGRDGIEGTVDDINNWDESKAWVEHYQKSKSWYWSDLLKSWYWHELWSDSWAFRMSLLVLAVLGLFAYLILALMQLIKRIKK